MSFSVWQSKPPFDEGDLTPGEKIYQVGDMWVVSSGKSAPTQAEVDAVLNPPSVVRSVAERLAALGLTVADLKAELAK